MPEFYDLFALDYSGARSKFLRAVESAGAKVSTYRHPTAKGPSGKDLSIDTAHLGNRDAARQLVIISGTHGQEGFAGSASQIGWITTGDHKTLPKDLGVLLIHGLNPYGFAHYTRTTENNVDLNRNFVDHTQPYPENPGYTELHPFLALEDWTSATLAASDEASQRYTATHGTDAFFDTMARGQYSHPDGLIYGGNQREWSNVTLEHIISDHLGAAQKIGLIDWHTGIGDFAQPFFLCFNEEGGDLQSRAAAWWGAERVLGQRPGGHARPNYQGLVFNGVQNFLGGRPMVGAVIEFGTRGPRIRNSLKLDLWLNRKADRESERYAMLRADMIDALNPYAQDWREATIRHGVEITRQAITGLSQWQ